MKRTHIYPDSCGTRRRTWLTRWDCRRRAPESESGTATAWRTASLYPWWDIGALTRCEDSCFRAWRTTDFWMCSRNLSKEGVDCGWRCAFALADLIANHGFLSYGLDPDLKCAYTLQGSEKKGSPPSPEKGFPGRSAECVRCFRTDTLIQYGSGAGKKGFDASVEDIKDCIKRSPARRDYSAFAYNCNDWAGGTQDACGLYCPTSDENMWTEYGGIPFPR